MAFSVTARHSGNNDQSPSQTLTTDSATPSASALLLVGSCAQNDAHTTTQAPQDPTGGSLAYTQVALTAQVPWESETQFGMRGVVYRAEPGASPSSFAITVDHYSGTQVAAYSAVALDVTGYDDADPITQSATNAETVDPSSGDASGTVTLPATPATGALVVAFFFAGEGSGAAGFAAPTIGGQSMTEAHNQTASWTQGGVWSREIDGTESNAVITCSDLGSDAGQYTAIAVEIAAESGAAEQDITPAAQTVDATPGTLALSVAADPAAVTVEATTGTLSMAVGVLPGAVTIDATAGTLTVAAGAVDITPDPVTIDAAPGTVAVTAGAVDITPDALTVEVTPGGLTLDVDVTLTGPTVEAAPGTMTVAAGAAPITPAPVTVAVTPGAVSITGGGIPDPNPFAFTYQESAGFTYQETSAFTYQEPQ